MKPRKPNPLSTDARPGRKDDPKTIAVREEIARQSEVQTSTGDGWDNPAIRAKRLPPLLRSP